MITNLYLMLPTHLLKHMDSLRLWGLEERQALNGITVGSQVIKESGSMMIAAIIPTKVQDESTNIKAGEIT